MPRPRPTPTRARAHAAPALPGAWRPTFLLALSELAVVQQACDAASINRRTAYRARKGDPGFAAAWDEAMEAGVDAAEAEAWRRAVDGVEEPVVHAGRVVKVRDAQSHKLVPLTVRRYSDVLLITILKGRRKAVYSERTEVVSTAREPTAIDGVGRAARLETLLHVLATRRATATSEVAALTPLAEVPSSEARATSGAGPGSAVRPPPRPNVEGPRS